MGWRNWYDDDDDEENSDNASEAGEPYERGPIEKHPLQTQICGALDLVCEEQSSSFSGFGTPYYAVDPGLRVDPLGPISLPLRDVDASRIIAASHQAPFGKGEATIVDTNVRKTWELNAGDFSLENIQFETVVQNAVAFATNALGVTEGTQVQAELYKLLLYEKSAMFKPHVDSEKAPGMFGTLVICLPSAHLGGDVLLHHGGRSVRYSTSMHALSYLCWYADVKHEIKPIEKGYRLVLTYNLIKSEQESASFVPEREDSVFAHKKYRPLQQHLSHWITQDWNLDTSGPDGWHKELIYCLEHRYTEASLAIDNFKAADLTKAKALEHFAGQMGYSLFLATMERQLHQSEDEIFDDEVTLKKVFDLDGTLLVSGIAVDEACVLQAEAFEDGREPDATEHEGFTGNAGASDTFWYRDTALVLVKVSQAPEFLMRSFGTTRYGSLGSPSSAVSLLKAWTIKARRSKDAVLRQQLGALCDHVLQANESGLQEIGNTTISDSQGPLCHRRLGFWQRFDDVAMGYVLVASVTSQDDNMMRRGIACVKDSLPPGAVHVLLQKAQTVPFTDIKTTLDSAVAYYTKFSHRYIALKSVTTRSEDKASTSIETWAIECLITCLEACTTADQEDGAALSCLLKTLSADADMIERIIPFIRRLASNGRFAVALLGMLVTDLNTAEDETGQLEKVFSQTYEHASLKIEPAETPQPRYGAPKPPPAANTLCQAPLNSLLMTIIRHSVNIRSTDMVLTILTNTTTGAQETSPKHLESICLPIIQELMVMRTSIPMDAISIALATAIRDILKDYILRFVGKQPPATGSWTRMPVNCSCGDCQWLNTFLRSPTQRVGRFPLAKKRRQHLHQRLDGGRQHCTHETERIGSPQTLVVTKKDVYGMLNQQWHERCRSVHMRLSALRQDYLRSALGTEYESVLNLWEVVVDFSRAPTFLKRRALADVQHNSGAVISTTSGMKRKADNGVFEAKKNTKGVIDLTKSP